MPDGLSKMEQMKVSISAHSLQPDVDFCRWRYTLIGCVVSFVRTVEAGERCDNIRDYATFSRAVAAKHAAASSCQRTDNARWSLQDGADEGLYLRI
jgi:hypothetical protein